MLGEYVKDAAIVPGDKGSRILPGKYYPQAVEIFTSVPPDRSNGHCGESFNQKSEGKYLCVRK